MYTSEVQRFQKLIKKLEENIKRYKEPIVPSGFSIVKSENSDTQWAAYDFDNRIVGSCASEEDAETLLALVQAFRNQKEPRHQSKIEED